MNNSPQQVPFAFEYFTAGTSISPIILEKMRLLLLARMEKDYAYHTQVIVTGDLQKTVTQRTSNSPYTTKRGSGDVAAVTLFGQGKVDIVFPLRYVQPVLEDILLHNVAHEAVHANLKLSGDIIANVNARKKRPTIAATFADLAAYLIEEYLAEYIAQEIPAPDWDVTSEEMVSVVEHLLDELATMPSVKTSQEAEQAASIAITALRVFWKKLIYLVAQLHTEDALTYELPDDIELLDEWQFYIEPYWDDFLVTLQALPKSQDIDIEPLDLLIEKLASLLQDWAGFIGTTFKDNPDGSWFFSRSIFL